MKKIKTFFKDFFREKSFWEKTKEEIELEGKIIKGLIYGCFGLLGLIIVFMFFCGLTGY